MKRLSNISPFILLLVPVFMMMLLIFSSPINNKTENDQVAVKTSPAVSIVKNTSALSK